MKDMWRDPQMRAWLHGVNRLLKVKFRDVECVVALDTGEVTAKQAVEVGYALLLGKPLVIAATRGAVIHDGLRRAADVILEDFDLLDVEGSRLRIQLAVESLVPAK